VHAHHYLRWCVVEVRIRECAWRRPYARGQNTTSFRLDTSAVQFTACVRQSEHLDYSGDIVLPALRDLRESSRKRPGAMS
jgi:hypothetical protein